MPNDKRTMQHCRVVGRGPSNMDRLSLCMESPTHSLMKSFLKSSTQSSLGSTVNLVKQSGGTRNTAMQTNYNGEPDQIIERLKREKESSDNQWRFLDSPWRFIQNS